MTAHDPRAEAFERLEGRYEVRVLEPSPPAVDIAPWFADDPAVPGEVPAGRQVVTPTSAGDVTWDELARADRDLGAWCAERWLGAWPTLAELTQRLAVTRLALHAVAEHVVAPARYAATGKIGLRWTRGGFGTPFFRSDRGTDRQVRVEGTDLVVVDGDDVSRAPLTTLRAAAEQAGVELGRGTDVYAPTTRAHPDRQLDVDAESARLLADWFGYATGLLEQLRAEAHPDDDASRVQLWPEHFDVAIELGPEDAGVRAAYGASPGDELHGVPYLYVAPWTPPAPDPLWSDDAFGGASLRYGAVRAVADERGRGLGFFREARQKLARGIRWSPTSA